VPELEHTMPTELRAGDSADWTAEAPSYLPADSWVLTYVLVSPTTQETIVAATSGTGYAAALTTTLSTTLAAGTWRWSAHVARNLGTPERVTLLAGTVEVLPNLAAASSGLDLRTTAEQLLDLVNTALAGALSTAQESKQVSTSAGTMAIKYVDKAELLVMRSNLLDQVASEAAARGIANGTELPRRIVARIVR
jgi:hypothetical protein